MGNSGSLERVLEELIERVLDRRLASLQQELQKGFREELANVLSRLPKAEAAVAPAATGASEVAAAEEEVAPPPEAPLPVSAEPEAAPAPAAPAEAVSEEVSEVATPVAETPAEVPVSEPAPSPEPVAADVPAPAAEPAVLSSPPETDSLPKEDRDAHRKAHRFARVAVQELVLYHKGEIDEGRKNKTLYRLLKEDIDKTRQNYQTRFGKTAARSFDYLHYELVLKLAENDPAALGEQYPGTAGGG